MLSSTLSSGRCCSKSGTIAASLPLLGITQIALICSVLVLMPMFRLRHCRRRSEPCFLHFHSPSPKNLIPVESTSKCSPDWLRVYGTCTFRSNCLLHSVLKSCTGKASSDSTRPVLCRRAKPHKFLSVKQNWIVASENFGLHPRLPLAAANQHIRLSSQTVKEPRALRAALYGFQLLVR